MRRHASNGPRPLAWRWVAGTLVVLLAAVCVGAWIDNEFGGGDYWGLAIEQVSTLWLAGFVAGCIVRRWEAIFLALLPILVAIPFGVQDLPNTGDPYFYVRDRVVTLMVPIALICAAFIVAGVLAAVVIAFIRGRKSAPAPG